MITIRNSIARMPILRKGGVHIQSKSSQRAKVKKNIKKALTELQNGKSGNKYIDY
ncbi:hypothetical protein QUF74_13190 [Candidatus Halobeggiatoa sp. HSG11]|nr:hypothetical protein [Candidatus Halobeggiatoa sp. HSG11]